MSELATGRPVSDLAIRGDQDFWTEKQTAALAQLGVKDASNADLAVFFHVATRSGLDPFARQIYMIGRREKDKNDNWITKQTIQTGIDGYRLIADRAARRLGEKRAKDAPRWCGKDMQWLEAWPFDEPPAAAKVVVYRDGEPFGATVMYREFAQVDRNGKPTSMWRRMPANQLAKCAEAAALRAAYPQDLAGIYLDEEMGQASNPEPVEHPHRVTAAEIRAPRQQKIPRVIDDEPDPDEPPGEPVPVGQQELADDWPTVKGPQQ